MPPPGGAPAPVPAGGSDSPVDVALIGAGLLGLATARALLERRPDLRLVVLEKEEVVAAHQSGHNSGVVHTGIHYPPGSLKARLCREGRALLEGYLEEKGIPFAWPGKLVVAVTEDELPRLAALKERARANGVEGLESESVNQSPTTDERAGEGAGAVLEARYEWLRSGRVDRRADGRSGEDQGVGLHGWSIGPPVPVHQVAVAVAAARRTSARMRLWARANQSRIARAFASPRTPM